MKNDHGITLVSLVVALVILFLLATISISYNLKSVEISNYQVFNSEMTIIQEKFDNIIEEGIDLSKYTKLASLDSSSEDYSQFKDIIENPSSYDIDIENHWTESDYLIENYYYFTPEDLENKIGLKGQKKTIIINFETKNIITKDFTKYNGINFYRKCDLNYKK